MNSLPKTVPRWRCGCDLNPGPSAHESSTLTTRLPSISIGVLATVDCSSVLLAQVLRQISPGWCEFWNGISTSGDSLAALQSAAGQVSTLQST